MNENIAAYIRLSKEDEREGESESVINQKELIKKYIEQNDLGICKFFIDDGYGGGDFERPQFKKMISEIEKGNIVTVITKDTSRLGRDFIETSYYMFKYFPEHNIRYIAILENFDTFNPNGVEDIIPFQTIINDWYLKDMSKKIKSVRQSKMRQGLYMGSTVPYGYRRDKENNCKFEIDEYSSLIVKKIFNMRLNGIKPSMIAKMLSDKKIKPPSIYNGKKINKTVATYSWSISTINQILTNPIYIGKLVQRKYDKINYKSKKKIKLNEKDWIVIENFSQPIIEKELFYKVQNMKERNISNNNRYNYWLRGLVICGDCGSRMSVRRKINKTKSKGIREDIYYCCSNNIRFGSKSCSFHYFQEKKLNNIVISFLKEIFIKHANKENLEEIAQKKKNTSQKVKMLEDELLRINKKIANINLALKNIYIDKTDNLISKEEFNELRKRLQEDKEGYIEEKQQIVEIKKRNKNANSIEELINNFFRIEEFDIQIIMELIKKIEIIEDKQIKIFANFNLN